MLQQHELTVWVILLGLGIAFGLGAMHALSPGHGKTIVAAYLVGSRGTLKHALFLGATVTATHTLSVFLLGIGVLLFEHYIIPDRIIPWLGGISGVSIVCIGVTLLYQRTKALLPSETEHAHSHHEHVHHVHSRKHEHPVGAPRILTRIHITNRFLCEPQPLMCIYIWRTILRFTGTRTTTIPKPAIRTIIRTARTCTVTMAAGRIAMFRKVRSRWGV